MNWQWILAYEIILIKLGFHPLQQITMLHPLCHQSPLVTSGMCFKVKQRNLLAQRTSTRTLEYPLPQHLSYPESIVEYQVPVNLNVTDMFCDLSKQSFTVDSETVKAGSLHQNKQTIYHFNPLWQGFGTPQAMLVNKWVVKKLMGARRVYYWVLSKPHRFQLSLRNIRAWQVLFKVVSTPLKISVNMGIFHK